ncbi:MAG: hypothetical protein ABIE43_00845 [Patescibacteria group bacterium]
MILVIVAIVFTILPIFDIIRSSNFSWQEPGALIIPFSGYYLDRLNEIKDGNIFLGNPYFIEHNQELAPAFFVADWVAYLPMLFGLSLPYSIIFNLFLWSLVFLILSFYIFNQAGVKKAVSAVGAILVYLIGYSLIIAPVSMQTIYPFYLLILLAFILWLEDPASRPKQIFLTLSLAACFYVYTYLWQIALTTCFLFLAYFLITKRKKEALVLLRILGLALLLSLPLFIYTFKQIMHPFYWETMQRIGFIKTHLPTAEVYYSGRWVILSLILWLWPRFINKDLGQNRQYNLLSIYFSLTGLSLVIVSASNFITGKELELAQHIVRFIKVWLGFSLISFVYFLFNNFNYFKASAIKLKNQLIVLALLLIVAGGAYGYLADSSFYYFQTRIDYSKQIDEYKQIQMVLGWLDKQERVPVVIMASHRSEFNRYVTTLTKHYVLFSDAGVLHLLSNKEAEERFLLNSTINRLSLKDIENDYQLFAGNGNALHPYKTHNRQVKICKILHLDLLNFNCGQEVVDEVSFKGEKYFADLFDRYQTEIIPNASRLLKKFNVSYILIDKIVDSNIVITGFSNINVAYQNQRFIVYKFSMEDGD